MYGHMKATASYSTTFASEKLGVHPLKFSSAQFVAKGPAHTSYSDGDSRKKDIDITLARGYCSLSNSLANIWRCISFQKVITLQHCSYPFNNHNWHSTGLGGSQSSTLTIWRPCPSLPIHPLQKLAQRHSPR